VLCEAGFKAILVVPKFLGWKKIGRKTSARKRGALDSILYGL